MKNGADFIRETFDGLLSQTYRNFEVCIHNDGSTDATAQIIDDYSKRFLSEGIPFHCSFESESKGKKFYRNFLRNLQNLFLGVGYGKNAAVKLASGRFLCFNDADDISLPNRLEVQLAACLNAPDPDHCFVGSRFERIPENSTERYTAWACNLTNEQLYNQVCF